MGCCGSKPPNPEVFLKDEQPAPANGYLHDSMPTEGLTMQAWSNFDPGNRYHSQSGALGALQTRHSDLERIAAPFVRFRYWKTARPWGKKVSRQRITSGL